MGSNLTIAYMVYRASAYLLVVPIFPPRFLTCFLLKLFTNIQSSLFFHYWADFLWKLTFTATLKQCEGYIIESYVKIFMEA